ncbi:MAG TPA: hypothetical protein VNU66_12860, partial [Mycobacteriales bacterium]|nr:hypothetical protein [Mycobacteriales bacterium]
MLPDSAAVPPAPDAPAGAAPPGADDDAVPATLAWLEKYFASTSPARPTAPAPSPPPPAPEVAPPSGPLP